MVEYEPIKESVREPFITEPTDYLQLMGALRQAHDTSRLKHLIQNFSGVFDPVLVAAALRRLPRLAKYKPEDLRRGVLTQVPADVKHGKASLPLPPLIPKPGARPREKYQETAASIALQLMALLVGQGNVRVAPGARVGGHKAGLWKLRGPGLQPTPEHNSEALAQRMEARQVATCVAALGKLYKQDVELDARLLTACVNSLLGNVTRDKGAPFMAKATCADVAALVKGLAQMRSVGYRREALGVLSAYTQRSAKEFNQRQVQAALKAFVILGHTPPDLIHTLASRAVSLAKGFTPQAIASVLLSLARSGVCTHVPVPTSSEAQGKPARRPALEVLSQGIAPQLMLLTPEDLAGMARAVAVLGQPYACAPPGPPRTPSSASGGPQAVPNPASLPAWLHGLVCMLAGKAARDAAQLQPSQLAAVLDMVSSLYVPHPALLQTVVDGLLVEDELDPSLSPGDGAQLLTALAVLPPLLPPGEPAATRAPVQVLARHAERHARRPELARRETAHGLGNLPVPAGEVDLLVQTVLGPLPGTGNAAESVDALSDAAMSVTSGQEVPRQRYQALLAAGAPFAQRVAAARERVMAVVVTSEQLSTAGVGELAALMRALLALKAAAEGSVQASLSQVAHAVQRRAETWLQERTPNESALHDSGARAHKSTAHDLHQVTTVMRDFRALGAPSTQVSLAAAGHVKSQLKQHPSLAPGLISTCVPLLEECRLHGAEPADALKAVASAYAAVGTATMSGDPSDPWPTHTASGLAPPPPRAADSPAAPWTVLSPTALAQLLQMCVANQVVDDALAATASAHVTHTLSGPTGAAGLPQDLYWMLPTAAVLAAHAKRAASTPSGTRLALELLATGIAQRLVGSDTAQVAAAQALVQELTLGSAPSGSLLTSLLGRGDATQQGGAGSGALVSAQALRTLSDAVSSAAQQS